MKTKTHFEWLLWHWSSLGQLNLEPTRPSGLVGCKVPTDLVKISVKEATHMGFCYIIQSPMAEAFHKLSLLLYSPCMVVEHTMEYDNFLTNNRIQWFQQLPSLYRLSVAYQCWITPVSPLLNPTGCRPLRRTRPHQRTRHPMWLEKL